jgi:hypothetical protein
MVYKINYIKNMKEPLFILNNYVYSNKIYSGTFPIYTEETKCMLSQTNEEILDLMQELNENEILGILDESSTRRNERFIEPDYTLDSRTPPRPTLESYFWLYA